MSEGVGVKLPESAAMRKEIPIASGCLDYFPDALAAVAYVSFVGNVQHNPGQPLHWDRSKSTDEADALMRHFMERGTVDSDGVRHSAKVAWRALALLQKEIENESGKSLGVSGVRRGGIERVTHSIHGGGPTETQTGVTSWLEPGCDIIQQTTPRWEAGRDDPAARQAGRTHPSAPPWGQENTDGRVHNPHEPGRGPGRGHGKGV